MVDNLKSEGLTGVTAIELRVAAVTFSVVILVERSNRAEMFVVPILTDFAFPLLAKASLMVATFVSTEDQVTSLVRSNVVGPEKVPSAVNSCVNPSGREGDNGAIVKAV